MEDIELVIKIPEHYYENNIKKDLPIYLTENNIIKILPKGYGRLIDADKLLYEDIESTDGNTYMVVNAYDIDNAPTIIEADKAESEDKE